MAIGLIMIALLPVIDVLYLFSISEYKVMLIKLLIYHINIDVSIYVYIYIYIYIYICVCVCVCVYIKNTVKVPDR